MTARTVGHYFIDYQGKLFPGDGTGIGVGYWRGSDWLYFSSGATFGHLNDSDLAWISPQIQPYLPPNSFYRWVQPPHEDWHIGLTTDQGNTYNIPPLDGGNFGPAYSKQDLELGPWVPMQEPAAGENIPTTARTIGYYFIDYPHAFGGRLGMGYWIGENWLFFSTREVAAGLHDSDLDWISPQIQPPSFSTSFYRWVKPSSGIWRIGRTFDGGDTFDLPDLSVDGNDPTYAKRDLDLGPWVPVQTPS